MADEQEYGYYDDTNYRIRDLEEKQRSLKERLLLFGENLLDLKEETSQEIIEIKKSIKDLQTSTEKLKSVIESISAEIPELAKKEDLEILSKQAKMFQPLEFVRKSDLERLKKNH